MRTFLVGERSFGFEGLVGGVTDPWAGGDLDGDLSLGGELGLVSMIMLHCGG